MNYVRQYHLVLHVVPELPSLPIDFALVRELKDFLKRLNFLAAKFFPFEYQQKFMTMFRRVLETYSYNLFLANFYLKKSCHPEISRVVQTFFLHM